MCLVISIQQNVCVLSYCELYQQTTAVVNTCSIPFRNVFSRVDRNWNNLEFLHGMQDNILISYINLFSFISAVSTYVW